MKRWKDRLATLFLVLALGLSLLPWVYEVRPAKADPQICYNDLNPVEEICDIPPLNCFCEVIITPQ